MAIFDILEGPWQGKMTYFRVYLKMKRTLNRRDNLTVLKDSKTILDLFHGKMGFSFSSF